MPRKNFIIQGIILKYNYNSKKLSYITLFLLTMRIRMLLFTPGIQIDAYIF